jgi:hypothetical protein
MRCLSSRPSLLGDADTDAAVACAIAPRPLLERQRALAIWRSCMRSTRWARWATLALAMSICVPVLAKSRAKSLADCTSFQQNDKAEDVVELSVHNSCGVPVDCTIKWRVVCAPDSKKRRAVHAKSSKFTLTEGSGKSAEATASACGDDAFAIDSIQWSCEPNKD